MGYQPMLGLIMFGMGLTLSPSYFRIGLIRFGVNLGPDMPMFLNQCGDIRQKLRYGA